MEFGKVSDKELQQIDFTLPPDPEVTKEVLAKGKGKTRFFIGCAKWGRKDWIGKLYPPKTKEKDFLHYYAQVFNAIEFNGFYYNLHPKEQVEKWIAAVPKDFIFCPKFTQYITHIKRLKDVQAEVDEYIDVISHFGKHLGPVFLMPHPQMGVKHLETIESFISDIPKDLKLFVELRHEDWYEGPSGYNQDLYAFLRRHKRGTIITDAAGRRDCVHMHLSTPECFIRFVGNSLHKTDYERMDDWVQRIRQWMDAGLEKCYFFMHQHEELHSPELIKYFIEQLNQHAGTSIVPPVMQYEVKGNTLF